VIVERVTETGTVRDRTSLWGIESNATDYLQETARDLAQELVSSAHTAQRQREVKQLLSVALARKYEKQKGELDHPRF